MNEFNLEVCPSDPCVFHDRPKDQPSATYVVEFDVNDMRTYIDVTKSGYGTTSLLHNGEVVWPTEANAVQAVRDVIELGFGPRLEKEV